MLDLSPIQEAEQFARRADALMVLASNVRTELAQAQQTIDAQRKKLDEELARMKAAAEEINKRKALLDAREATLNAREAALDSRETTTGS